MISGERVISFGRVVTGRGGGGGDVSPSHGDGIFGKCSVGRMSSKAVDVAGSALVSVDVGGSLLPSVDAESQGVTPSVPDSSGLSDRLDATRSSGGGGEVALSAGRSLRGRRGETSSVSVPNSCNAFQILYIVIKESK